MGGGGTEPTIPIVIGMLALVFVLAFMISNMSSIIGGNTETPGGLSFEEQSPFIAYNSTSHTAPTTFRTYWAVSSSNVSTTYVDSTVGRHMTFDTYGSGNSRDITTYVIRNSAQYVSNTSTDEWKKYHDYVIADQWGGFLYLFVDREAVSYQTIAEKMNSTNSNVTAIDITLWDIPYTLGFDVAGGVGTEAAWTTNLYANHFNLTVGYQKPLSSANAQTSWSSVLWSILTFNTDWLPTNWQIAFFVSFIVDGTLVLCAFVLVSRLLPDWL